MSKAAIDVSKLSSDEKFELIDELWRSLSPDDFVLTPELKSELDRRLDRIDREGPQGISWERLRSKMLAR